MATFGGGGVPPDNEAIRQIRDILKGSQEILKESQRQSKYMFRISVFVGLMTFIQLIFLIIQVTFS